MHLVIKFHNLYINLKTSFVVLKYVIHIKKYVYKLCRYVRNSFILNNIFYKFFVIYNLKAIYIIYF